MRIAVYSRRVRENSSVTFPKATRLKRCVGKERHIALMNDILSQTVTFVLAGGRGERLRPLTLSRSKPAVPFGDGHIIDFTLANCLRSKLPHPLVLTQYQSCHLTHHVGRWWLRQPASSGAAEAAPVCVPAPERHYFGSADALFRSFQFLQQETEHVLVLSADHIYEMDYRELLQFHVDKGADVTLASIVYPSRASRQFGILGIDESSRVVSFEEKPALPRELPSRPGKVLANMGVYVFLREVFLDAFLRDSANPLSHHDIGKDVLPGLVAGSTVYAFPFAEGAGDEPGYWRDVGTLDSYYDASMEWLGRLPATHRLSGSTSVISDGVRVHSAAEVRDSVLMPGVVIGAGARVRRAILDENVHVMPGAHIGFGNADSRDFPHTSGGVCVVPANTIFRPGSGSLRVRQASRMASDLRLI